MLSLNKLASNFEKGDGVSGGAFKASWKVEKDLDEAFIRDIPLGSFPYPLSIKMGLFPDANSIGDAGANSVPKDKLFLDSALTVVELISKSRPMSRSLAESKSNRTVEF